jgi:hypothetical protein
MTWYGADRKDSQGWLLERQGEEVEAGKIGVEKEKAAAKPPDW